MDSPKFCLRLPEEWQDQIKRQASRKGMTASAWIRKVIADNLPKEAKKKLPEVSAGRNKIDH